METIWTMDVLLMWRCSVCIPVYNMLRWLFRRQNGSCDVALNLVQEEQRAALRGKSGWVW